MKPIATLLLLISASLLVFTGCKKTVTEQEAHPWPAFETLEEELHGAVEGGPTNAVAIASGVKALLDGGIPKGVTKNDLVETIFSDIKTIDLSGAPPVDDLHALLLELAHESGLPHDCDLHDH